MIRVMIADDEPFIRQGLKILINWEQYGFKVCGEASNGKEVLKLLETEKYDLIIADIKMPKMSGIELIEHVWENISKDIKFLILSGFYEFEYAKKAIKYGVVDYILKPVQKEELIRVLENYKEQYFKQEEGRKLLEYSEKIVFDSELTKIILGKYEEDNLKNVTKYIPDDTARYISIEYDPSDPYFISLSTEEKRIAKRLLYDSLKDYLGNNWFLAYSEDNLFEEIFGVGFIYVRHLREQLGISEKEYIKKLYEAISQAVHCKINIYIGQQVDSISRLTDSYKSVSIARSLQMFSKNKSIAYYDEIEGKMQNKELSVDKDMMDGLIRAIEENNEEMITRGIESFYAFLKGVAAEPDFIKLNIDYMLFNLINLAKELDPETDQEEVYRMISKSIYGQATIRGSIRHFKDFAMQYANYLSHLRHHAFGGVLVEIEKEITDHYMENLSLKSLSEKYFINSAYLGQIFKKQFGISFKDYLNNYRIDKAAELLIRSNEKIYLIAGAVGFNNTDYFISKFVQIKGITPLQYRKQFCDRRQI
jgi:two-component system response regulator YesN